VLAHRGLQASDECVRFLGTGPQSRTTSALPPAPLECSIYHINSIYYINSIS